VHAHVIKRCREIDEILLQARHPQCAELLDCYGLKFVFDFRASRLERDALFRQAGQLGSCVG
jgi:hypothetical protein